MTIAAWLTATGTIRTTATTVTVFVWPGTDQFGPEFPSLGKWEVCQHQREFDPALLFGKANTSAAAAAGTSQGRSPLFIWKRWMCLPRSSFLPVKMSHGPSPGVRDVTKRHQLSLNPVLLIAAKHLTMSEGQSRLRLARCFAALSRTGFRDWGVPGDDAYRDPIFAQVRVVRVARLFV